MKYYPHRETVDKFVKGASQLVQQENMVAQNLAPSQGGNTGHSHQVDASSNAYEVHMFKVINVTTRVNTYDTLPSVQTKGKDVDHLSTYTPLYSNHLQIDNPTFDSVLHRPKSVFGKEIFNPNSHATQNYKIVEYLV
jgi:hypothetical protein